jgi:hypothetical protein
VVEQALSMVKQRKVVLAQSSRSAPLPVKKPTKTKMSIKSTTPSQTAVKSNVPVALVEASDIDDIDATVLLDASGEEVEEGVIIKSDLSPHPVSTTRPVQRRKTVPISSSRIDTSPRRSLPSTTSVPRIASTSSSTSLDEVEQIVRHLETISIDHSDSPTSATLSSKIATTQHSFPSKFTPLLVASSSPIAFDFTSFVAAPPLPFASSPWHKIGEASYSEVFSARDIEGNEMVIKIIPISDHDGPTGDDIDELEDVPYSSEWESILREVEISRLVGEQDSTNGFVKFKS